MLHEAIRPASILGTEAAIALFRPMLAGCTTERLCVAHLDGNGQLLDMTCCPLGTDREVRVPLRGIVHDALEAKARAMIMAHNHPHGVLAPSEADLRTTRRIAEVCRELEIALVDHLLFAGPKVVSFRGSGLL